MISQARAISAFAALGEGICEAIAGTAAHSETPGIDALRKPSCTTLIIPVGPS